METANYKVELRLDGLYIGDCRSIAQNLTWAKRRTSAGVDEIDFTLNDVKFEEWLNDRSTTINDVLRPLALDCRIVRNGVEIVGGFLATMPAYSPNGTSANLAMKFDGYLNLLDGVYIPPTAKQTKRMNVLIAQYIAYADSTAESAGKAFGFTAGKSNTMSLVDHTFDSYKSVKEFITDRCDNVSGAGQFEVYFHPDRTYDIIKDSNFGTTQNYVINFPMTINNLSATSISASEVSDFASSVICVGAGETSSDSEESTAIVSQSTSDLAVATYGYKETLYQDSSISVQTTLDQKAETLLDEKCDPQWDPEITLTGLTINPAPSGDPFIWIGDTITIVNDSDLTGQTNGEFRVQELSVSVSATGAETITPVLKRED